MSYSALPHTPHKLRGNQNQILPIVGCHCLGFKLVVVLR